MAQSWRLKTVEQDNTEKANISTATMGATVIVSPKGPKTFTKFNKGDTQGILNTFGYPSKDYPTIQDALDVVQKCTMYVASPYKGGTYGGAFVTKSMGTIPFNTGVSTKEITDYTSVAFTNSVGIGDSTTLSYTYTIKYIEKYKAESLTLSIGGVAHEIKITSSEKVETITDNESGLLDEGCTLNTETGVLTLVFKTAPSTGTTISIGYTMDMSDTYFVLFDKDMQEDDLQIKVTLSEDIDDAFEIVVARYDPINLEYTEINNSPFVVGLSETSKNSYGDNIYINNIFGDNQTLFDAHVVNSIVDGFMDDDSMVNLSGGSRGTEVEGADVANIYEQLIDTNKYQLKFCVDGTNYTEVITKFENLRNSYQKRCRFIYCTADVDGNTIVENPNDYNFGVTANRGMYQYCLNWGIHSDIYQGNPFKCSNMGLIASCIVDYLDNEATTTSAPAWIPENGVGGVLGSSITKLSQDTTSEDVLEMLDNLNFNAVINDYNYGAMISGWRTRQVKKTDLSNIPISSLVDTLIEQIEKNVLPSRIGKMIDEASYSVVRSGCNSILGTYSNRLEDYYVWCDSENNTAEMRNQERLVVAVGIVPKKFARTILLNFNIYKSGVDVEVEMTK